ncbi:MAG: hypothetical protein AB8B52_06980 [Winogradskyella sp.]|uniref:hypothetical protein n=1 Tax=Winogradskyella sp. TaxID=1883156 RepID=UPI00385E050B
MESNDLYYLNLLKASVVKTFSETNKVSKDVKQWTGDDIVLFQEDLLDKVKTRVSEKWFYTYFKNEAEKLPRVDMLNLLSQYVGFENWSEFKLSSTQKNNQKSKSLLFYALPILLIVSVITFWTLNKSNTYNFCFVNDINGLPIKNITLDVKIINGNETPIYLKSDSNGCITYKTKKDYVTFVVQSPYHKTDTVIKSINNLNNGTVKLSTDDYALMLDYYSNKKLINWKEHRKNLDFIFASNAVIFQVYPNNLGIELYTKDEFINKLTIPTKSLKQMKILSKSYVDGKIVKLKFIVE